MPLYVQVENEQPVGFEREFEESWKPADVAHKRDWRKVIYAPPATYDPSTHTVDRDVYHKQVFPNRVEYTPVVRPFTEEEIERRARRVRRNRIRRMLELIKNDAGTPDQQIKRLNQAVVELSLHVFGTNEEDED